MLERVLSVGGEVDERQLLGLDRRLLVDRVELEDRWCENRGVCGADGDDGERRGRRLTRCDPVAAAAEAYAHRLLVLGGARQGVTADRYIQPVRAVPHLVGAHNEIAEQFVQDRGPERQIAAVGECEDDVGLAQHLERCAVCGVQVALGRADGAVVLRGKLAAAHRCLSASVDEHRGEFAVDDAGHEWRECCRGASDRTDWTTRDVGRRSCC
jgi:hypothetical protein